MAWPCRTPELLTNSSRFDGARLDSLYLIPLVYSLGFCHCHYHCASFASAIEETEEEEAEEEEGERANERKPLEVSCSLGRSIVEDDEGTTWSGISCSEWFVIQLISSGPHSLYLE